MRKQIIIIFSLISTINIFGQNSKNDTLDLAKINLCVFTLQDLKKQDPSIEKVAVTEMDLCSDGFVQDARFENRIGYKSKEYIGILFQKDNYSDAIAKLRLTKDFKGKLPDGTYIDVSTLSAKNIIEKYPELDTWNSRGCSEFWSLTDEHYYFYVQIDKEKEPRYPIDKNYYLTKPIEGIDIILNRSEYCSKINPADPLIILDGKEVKKEDIENLTPENVESITVLKESAIEEYGEKGKNGVIVIKTKSN
ncbi:hypothetical protein [Zunongwangia pacifica]|uniref:TonB-dependent receptor plug domain-containing protein n=1 Tax=Zunongwangia pacifica TaxID=2911062 RepID=A0A9X1ZXD2_9FLAO|nr:hypothetical protein [Zunongwangia pacifica]MCL6219443.1 hypothetical protein [Zunongwangia pacifica]